MAVDHCLDEEACGADFSKRWMVFVFVLICIGGGCGGGGGFFWRARRGPMSMFDREVGQGMFVACGSLRLGGLDDIDE